MSKYVRRIIPFGSGDIPAVQHWLEDMAEKGLFFKECGLLFAKFTRGEPKKMRYRLDFCDVVACDIPDEKKELYEQSGWQVVGDYNSDLVVVCTDAPDAPEIYTDPELLVKPLKKITDTNTAEHMDGRRYAPNTFEGLSFKISVFIHFSPGIYSVKNCVPAV